MTISMPLVQTSIYKYKYIVHYFMWKLMPNRKSIKKTVSSRPWATPPGTTSFQQCITDKLNGVELKENIHSLNDTITATLLES